MDINLAVSYKDGSEAAVEVEYVDCIEFERKFKQPIAGIVTEVLDDDGNLRWNYDKNGRRTTPMSVFKAEHLAFLAWTNQHRTGSVDTDFDPWLETVAGVQLAAPKETPPTRTPRRSK